MSSNSRPPLFRYNPSLPAAVADASLFALFTIAHLFIAVRRRSWYFIPFVVGGAFEAVGYGFRAKAHDDQYARGPYIAQTILLLVSPALFAATIYMILGRIIIILDARHLSPIRVTRLTKIFVGGDIVTFIVQGGGGAILARSETKSAQNTGKWVIEVGLLLQILIFGLFVFTAFRFHLRIRKNPTSAASHPSLSTWTRHQAVLYVSSFLILARNVVRVVEYIQGRSGYIQSHEYFLYVFDGLLMLLVVLIFLLVHPARLLSQKDSVNANRVYLEEGMDQSEMQPPRDGQRGSKRYRSTNY